MSAVVAQNRRGARFFLLADAEGGKNQVEDVVAGGLAGEGVEGPEGAIKVDQNHFVGNVAGVGLRCIRERCAGSGDGLLVSEAREKAGFGGGSAGGEGQNAFAEGGDAFAGESGCSERLDGLGFGTRRIHRRSVDRGQIAFVNDDNGGAAFNGCE
jgi:hypothetical protein